MRFWLEERGSRLVEEVALELRFESEIRAETLNVQRQKSRDGVGEERVVQLAGMWEREERGLANR